MKANELRIGNLVKSFSYDEPIEVHSVCNVVNDIFNRTTGEIPIDTILPIPLTEEWLLKFGFEININKDSGCGYSFLGDFNLWVDNGKIIYWKVKGSVLLKNVHQLQNLYFALTVEELTINKY